MDTSELGKIKIVSSCQDIGILRLPNPNNFGSLFDPITIWVHGGASCLDI